MPHAVTITTGARISWIVLAAVWMSIAVLSRSAPPCGVRITTVRQQPGQVTTRLPNACLGMDTRGETWGAPGAIRSRLSGWVGDPSDRLAVVLVLLFSALATAVGRRAGLRVLGLDYLAVLACAWRLGRSRHSATGPAAVMLVGMWMVAAAPNIFLHPELWGLPLALAGVLAARRDRWALAAVLIGCAVLFQELYSMLFLAGLIV